MSALNKKLLSVAISSFMLTACGSGSSSSSDDSKEETLNTAPTFTEISSITFDEDTTKAIQLSASDPEGDALTYSIASADDRLGAVISGNDLNLTPQANYFGESSMTLEVSDGDLSDQISVTVNVAAINDRPTLSALEDINIDEDGAFSVDLDVQDVDNDTLNFSFSEVAEEFGLSVEGQKLVLSPADNFYGETEVALSVSDGKLESEIQFSVTINSVNDAPQFGIFEDVSVKNTEPYKIVSIPVSDADGDRVGLSVKSYDDTQMVAVFKGSNLIIAPFEHAVSETELVLEVTDGTDTTTKAVTIAIEKSYSFFAGSNEINGYELWKTDGTEAGTELVKDIYSGPNSSEPHTFYHGNNKVFFLANDSESSSHRLWVSDGTAEGTKELYTVQALTNVNSFAEKDGDLYFIAKPDNGTSSQLWKTDGTEDGTAMVFKDSDQEVTQMSSLYSFDNKLYFVADGGPSIGREVFTYDGSSVSLLKDINPGFNAGVNWYTSYFPYLGKLCFKAMAVYHNLEVWCTDGTTDGTKILFDLNGLDSSNGYGFTVVDNSLYFIATTKETGYEPYRFLGEFVGLLRDIRITPSASNSSQNNYGVTQDYFTRVGDRLHFFATDGFSTNRYGINLNSAIGPENPYPTADPVSLGGLATGLNGNFVFENNSNALWSRTETSAILLHNFQADDVPGDITPVTTFSRQRVNGKLFFGAKYGFATIVPWATDGKSSEQTTSLGNVSVMQIIR